MSNNTEITESAVIDETNNPVEPVEAPKGKGRKKQTVSSDNTELELLKQQLELQQQQIAMLLQAQGKKKEPPVCCAYLIPEIDKVMQKNKKSQVFKLKKEISINGYCYKPFRNDGTFGPFVILGNKTDNSVLFLFKKTPQGCQTEPGKTACSLSEEVICRTNVSTNEDWIRAEGEMVYKFNSGLGRMDGITVSM